MLTPGSFLCSAVADIKLALLDNPASLDKAWDLTIHSGQMVKKTSEIFVPPKTKLGGKFHLARIYELDDVAYGTSFAGQWVQGSGISGEYPFPSAAT